MLKNKNRLRDLLFFIFLILLIKYATDLEKEKPCAEQQEQPPVEKAFAVHELDEQFLDSIKTTRHDLQSLENATKKQGNYDNYKAQLDELTEELDHIETKYKKNSPALALLGPLGSASIVLKEQELAKKLAGIADTIKRLSNSVEEKKEMSKQE